MHVLRRRKSGTRDIFLKPAWRKLHSLNVCKGRNSIDEGERERKRESIFNGFLNCYLSAINKALWEFSTPGG